jgi:hypothetical protein
LLVCREVAVLLEVGRHVAGLVDGGWVDPSPPGVVFDHPVGDRWVGEDLGQFLRSLVCVFDDDDPQ